MATPQLSPDELLQAIQRLGTREIEHLVVRILQLRAERSAPNLPPRETELLAKINQGLPIQEARRYQDLMGKRRTETLTPEEHEELLRLTDAAEAIQAERIWHLAELARIRGTTLDELMEELGLHPASHG
jgi:hypothetical protein